MMNQLLFSLSLLLLIFHFSCTTTLAQSPAQAPGPPAPTNVTKILEKAGQFTTFIRLLKITQVANQMNGQLNDSNNGLTLFAPSDSAFSSLKAGILNSLSDEQKSELVQFHVIPSYLSISQFQTVSNPMRTQAGGSGRGEFPINVTTSGNNVNMSTGVVNSSVSGTVYTDGQLAVYEVDNVLLPQKIFDPLPPAPAPAPATPKKKKSRAAVTPSSDDNTSGAVSLTMHGMAVSIGVAVTASFLL